MQLIRKKDIALVCSALFALSAIIIDQVIFIRMYIMLTSWILFFIYWHLKHWHNHNSFSFYFVIMLNCLTGMLTHYYFALFAFFFCTHICIATALNKKWKSLLLYMASLFTSGLLSIILFPAILGHLFSSSRSVDSVDKLIDFTTYWYNLKSFWQYFNEICGGLLTLLVMTMLLNLIFNTNKSHKKISVILKNLFLSPLFIVSCSAFFYYILVSKIAIFTTARYISPIFPLIIIMFVIYFFKFMSGLLKKELPTYVLIILAAFILLYGFNNANYSNLYSKYRETKAIASNYSDC
jgi:hypothetical protein